MDGAKPALAAALEVMTSSQLRFLGSTIGKGMIVVDMTGTGDNNFAEFEPLDDSAVAMGYIDDILERISLFEDFERSDVMGVARQMRFFRAPAGREIIREGEPGDFMLLLLRGGIEVVKRGASGLPHRIAVVTPGETLGEMSLVDGAPRFASCLAIDEITFAVLHRDSLDEIFQAEPHLGIKVLRELLKLLNQRLRDTGARLVDAIDR